MKSKLLLAAFMFFTLGCKDVLSATIYAGSGAVTRYYPVNGHVAYFTTGAAKINPAGCVNGYYYTVPFTHPEYEEYKKVILTALASGKKIGVYLYADQCVDQHSSVHSIFIDG